MHERATLEQAKQFDSLLLAMGREVFVIEDDAKADLPLAQMRVCAVLYRGPCSMSELSRELRVSLSAATQIADRLERARLVRRVAGHADRRVRRLQLTARGQRFMHRLDDARVGRILAAFGRLSPKARKEVLAALEVFVGACAAAAQAPVRGGKPALQLQH